MQPRNLAFAVASSLALMLAAQPADAGQKVKTKSNIKNDRMANTCTKDCLDAGYAWARENGAASDADCDATVEDFARGCRDFVAHQLDAATPADPPAN